jgi:hypothetical protein
MRKTNPIWPARRRLTEKIAQNEPNLGRGMERSYGGMERGGCRVGDAGPETLGGTGPAGPAVSLQSDKCYWFRPKAGLRKSGWNLWSKARIPLDAGVESRYAPVFSECGEGTARPRLRMDGGAERMTAASGVRSRNPQPQHGGKMSVHLPS